MDTWIISLCFSSDDGETAWSDAVTFKNQHAVKLLLRLLTRAWMFHKEIKCMQGFAHPLQHISVQDFEVDILPAPTAKNLYFNWAVMEEDGMYTTFAKSRMGKVEAYVVPVNAAGLFEFLRACLSAAKALGHSDLFGTPVVAALVQAYWHKSRSEMRLMRQCVLHLGLLVSFVLASRWFSWVFEVAKLAFLVPLILHERLSFRANEHSIGKYLEDSWNLVDPIMYLLVIAGIAMRAAVHILSSANGADSAAALLTAANAVDAVTALLLWFKIIYFLRLILLILLVVLLGFANAFYVILKHPDHPPSACAAETDAALKQLCEGAEPPPGSFSTMWRSVRSVMAYVFGDFDLNELDEGPTPALLSCLWFLLMVLAPVLLLKIIITLLGASYERLSGNRVAEWRMQQASIMLERRNADIDDFLEGGAFVFTIKPVNGEQEVGPDGQVAPRPYITVSADMEKFSMMVPHMGEARARQLFWARHVKHAAGTAESDAVVNVREDAN
ncbi:hypothetical protein JKP88DRAFT_284329 [Tribonema minus]|uniref:Ion transport domain-containing protein n=1 Tax=Tribonema minus TaxID=303371 RepID=A0A836CMZ4_9STRA|nr:hypothetical protein JKP88DRAFT_284329 [Tribonema minus]